MSSRAFGGRHGEVLEALRGLTRLAVQSQTGAFSFDVGRLECGPSADESLRALVGIAPKIEADGEPSATP